MRPATAAISCSDRVIRPNPCARVPTSSWRLLACTLTDRSPIVIFSATADSSFSGREMLIVIRMPTTITAASARDTP